MGWHIMHHAERATDEKPVEVPTSTLLKWFLKILVPMKFTILAIILISIVSIGLNVVTPYLSKLIIDNGIMARDANALALYTILAILAVAAGALLTALRRYLTACLNQRLLFDLRRKTFQHLMEIDVHYVTQRPSGRIISLVTNDIAAIGEIVTMGVIEFLVSASSILGAIYMMLNMHLTLTLAVISTMPIMFVLTRFFAKKAREVFRETRVKVSQLTSSVEQSVSGARVAQAFTERRNIDAQSFERISRETMSTRVKAILVSSLIRPSLDSVRALSFAILIGYGGLLIVSHEFTIGGLLAFYGYTESFFRPIMIITMFYTTLQSALAAAERVYIFLNTEPVVKDTPYANDLEINDGEIAVENVSFSYDSNTVFENISFKVKAGEILAIVGPTGAGKTTLANLILRLYDPQKGRIVIDGHDLREFTLSSLRKATALVPQEPILFNDTVFENIRAGFPEASRGQVENIIKSLGLEKLIESLPQGYDTIVAPGGENLSVGQRQLISFARAMLKNPRILILDEATSSLDSRTESMLQEAMVKLLKGRTCIIIAHRLATVKLANMIIVLDNGRIVEEGSHEQLLRRGGLYAKLYETQFGISIQPLVGASQV
ncbi:ABC transporter ATP-binding protein [Candidatus Bathyarchaeota archaeon]|nr:ABC transporter ATP-binding protein [Candidatus Bathyarchaeota archaeon]MBS7618605.1 ABC transporter ATP-binding protein [Candidatus Bathyarchaeota archaeon]